jgi:hypothetical protein
MFYFVRDYVSSDSHRHIEAMSSSLQNLIMLSFRRISESSKDDDCILVNYV